MLHRWSADVEVGAECLQLADLLLRRNVPGLGEPGPGEAAEGPARPVQLLGEAFGQDAYRRSLEVQRDAGTLKGGGQGKPER
jgi:hypothetical protein